VPRSALSLWVSDVDDNQAPRLTHGAAAAVNPASLMKLVTTYAALDLLGPAFTWGTTVYIDGPVKGNTLHGNLYIKGDGDPKLVIERLWLLLRKVQGLGIRHIAGHILLDRSAFALPAREPGAFDGEALRPYNAAPDALLVNYRAMTVQVVPDTNAGVARLVLDVPLHGVSMPDTIALNAQPCGDWRASMGADFSRKDRIAFKGSYPASCGERSWPVAYSDPPSHLARTVEGLWRELGGQLTGTVSDGVVPPSLLPFTDVRSPTLAEVIRDINKFSNNVMAQQLFLTLGRGSDARTPATWERSRERVRQWWISRWALPPPELDNGSGLSRQERISALSLGMLLRQAWQSPLMPELLASLPAAGIDGTLRRSTTLGRVTAGSGKESVAPAIGAHLKTGTLRDVAGIAGYVHAASGKRYVLVAIINHDKAPQARAVLDAALYWTAHDVRP
jgi:D-alanyl-D-alanine carboxypeptidase/D-alanyl-D-alanine-endopeptidase (penicillin-binding protein 4)